MGTIMEAGTIKAVRVDRGYGFIHSGGRDIFFHVTGVADGLAFDEQLVERRVEFNIVGSEKGDRAVNVRAAE